MRRRYQAGRANEGVKFQSCRQTTVEFKPWQVSKQHASFQIAVNEVENPLTEQAQCKRPIERLPQLYVVFRPDFR
jgi:hypothetical protein